VPGAGRVAELGHPAAEGPVRDGVEHDLGGQAEGQLEEVGVVHAGVHLERVEVGQLQGLGAFEDLVAHLVLAAALPVVRHLDQTVGGGGDGHGVDLGLDLAQFDVRLVELQPDHREFRGGRPGQVAQPFLHFGQRQPGLLEVVLVGLIVSPGQQVGIEAGIELGHLDVLHRRGLFQQQVLAAAFQIRLFLGHLDPRLLALLFQVQSIQLQARRVEPDEHVAPADGRAVGDDGGNGHPPDPAGRGMDGDGPARFQLTGEGEGLDEVT